MDSKIKGLDEFKKELGKFKAMSQPHEDVLDEFKDELGESQTEHLHMDEDELDEFKDELSESVEDNAMCC